MTFRVESEVLAFAQEPQDLLDGVLPRPDDVAEQDRQVKVEVVVGQSRYRVQVAARNGLITLTKNRQPVASLRVTYQCTADSSGTYLAVHRSDYELRGWTDKTPIARLDFLRDAHTIEGADTLLCAGRERWRRRQIATLVRDAPDEAVRVLRELGYVVDDPPS